MLIDHQDQQIVLRKTRNLELCFGTNVGTHPAKIEKISISRSILLEFLRSLVSTIRCEANKINRRREERPIGSRAVKMLRDLRQGARGLAHHVAAANARAEVRARMHNWSIWWHNDVKDRRAQQVAWWLARKCYMRAGMAQMKYRYFVPEHCKQNAIFSGTSHQNRSYLDNISTNQWYIVGFQQGHCSRKVTDENIKISLPILQVLTPKFHSNSISALCKGWLQWIASMKQGLLTMQNHHGKNSPSDAIALFQNFSESNWLEKLKFSIPI